MRILDPDAISMGYLLPTREAVTLGRPAAKPLLELGERAEALGFDAIWLGDGPLARSRHDALLARMATEGLIVSEAPPGGLPLRRRFLVRKPRPPATVAQAA